MSEKKPLKNKDRMKKPRNEMPLHPAEERIHNLEEVPVGYSLEQAQDEATRCIQCKKPDCIPGCPVGIDIPAFLKFVENGDIAAAAKNRTIVTKIEPRLVIQFPP